tara:strand:+ start:693 stop:1457 length:765 start_codon:yes stop_codon:yes gene_type:complete
MSVPNLYSYLMPFLTDEEGLHDPMQWMGEYGMYLTPYDEAEEALVAEQVGIASQILEPQAWNDIQNIQKGLGATGFAGSYMEGRTDEALDKTAQGLSLTRLQGLNRQKALQKAYESEIYAELQGLASMDAFVEDGPGWGDPITGVAYAEWLDMAEGHWADYNEAYDYYGEEYIYGTDEYMSGAMCDPASMFYDQGQCNHMQVLHGYPYDDTEPPDIDEQHDPSDDPGYDPNYDPDYDPEIDPDEDWNWQGGISP